MSVVSIVKMAYRDSHRPTIDHVRLNLNYFLSKLSILINKHTYSSIVPYIASVSNKSLVTSNAGTP